jgi:hypothetical protein
VLAACSGARRALSSRAACVLIACPLDAHGVPLQVRAVAALCCAPPPVGHVDEIGYAFLPTMLADVADEWWSTRVESWLSAVDGVLAACSPRCCCCLLPAAGPRLASADLFGAKQRALGADQHVFAAHDRPCVRPRPSISAVVRGDCHSLWHSVVDLSWTRVAPRRDGDEGCGRARREPSSCLPDGRCG